MALSRATVRGYHSALHDSDNVQHADSDCPAASNIHHRCDCSDRQPARLCSVCAA